MFPTKLVLAKMLPGKSANTYSIYVDLPKGSSYLETSKVTTCIVNILKKESEVENIEIFSGMGAPLDYAGLVKGSALKRGENVAEIVVNLTEIEARNEKSFSMVHRLRPVIQSTCESIINKTSIKMVEEPAGPPTQAAVVVELYGKDGDGLTNLGMKIEDILKKTDGLVDVDTLEDEIYEKFELNINKEKIIRSHLSIKQVNEILYLAFEGSIITVKNSEDSPEQIPLFLVLEEGSKSLNHFNKVSLERKLASLKLMNDQGMMIPLNELVSVTLSKSKPTIMSKNLQRVVTIVAEADMVSQVYPLLDARSSLIEELSNDYEISNGSLFNLVLKDKKTSQVFNLVWDGEMKVTMDTFRDLGAAFIAALVIIFLLMVIYYKSFALSGIVLLGSFLSIIGVIVGHWIIDIFTKETFFLTATSLIGFIALMGISSRNSLLLIDFAVSLIEEKDMKKKRAIAVSAATRAKPIFLTAVTILLASAMLVVDPIFGGLGVALIFGTVAAVIVSLVFIPVLMDNTKAI
jgi:multidrug efflux pump subunit AcrB